MGADNQQGRSKEALSHYIAGFVDGEGTFHVGIHRREALKLGWQVYCEFHVSQHEEKTPILEQIKAVFGCGYIKQNHAKRIDDLTKVFVVRNQRDLCNKVIPFFKKYPLLSSKAKDFEKFAFVLNMINRGEHLKAEGLKRISEIAFSMYGNGRYRKTKLEEIIETSIPSETIRQSR